MACGIIYCITNSVSGKQYVGQTVRSVKMRWQIHLQQAKADSPCFLHQAIRKHGAEVFKVKQVDSAETLEELNEKEVHYIEKLKTLAPDGYNLTVGGEGTSGWHHSEKTCQKISNCARMPHTKETREKISRSSKASHPRKLFCKRGHALDEVNTYTTPSTGHRYCLVCFYTLSNRKIPQKLASYASSINT